VSGVEHSVLVQRPIQAVNAALGAGPRKWFPHLDGSSATDPEGLELRRKVKVDVGKPVTQGDRTEVPVTWHATFIKDLFPVMTGKVEFASAGPRTTRLNVCGMYELPLGRSGKPVDEALIYRVAKATVKDVAESIATRLDLLAFS
jgi:hypothetical protein